jgi:transposase-like protein
MAKRRTREEKAAAVAQVLAGQASRRQVADQLGVSDSTVRRWMGEAERRETAQEKDLAERAEDLAEEIQDLQEQVRHQLLERIAALIPDTDSVRELGTVYGIVTDKSLLTRGKATGRTEVIQKDSVDTEIANLLETMARREAAGSNGTG